MKLTYNKRQQPHPSPVTYYQGHSPTWNIQWTEFQFRPFHQETQLNIQRAQVQEPIPDAPRANSNQIFTWIHGIRGDYAHHISSVMKRIVHKHVNPKTAPILTSLNKLDSVLLEYVAEQRKQQEKNDLACSSYIQENSRVQFVFNGMVI